MTRNKMDAGPEKSPYDERNISKRLSKTNLNGKVFLIVDRYATHKTSSSFKLC